MIGLLQGLVFTTIDATIDPMGRRRGVFHAWRSTQARLGNPASQTRFDLTSIAPLSRWRKVRLGWRMIRQAIRGK